MAWFDPLPLLVVNALELQKSVEIQNSLALEVVGKQIWGGP
jgi:hypothetical protein